MGLELYLRNSGEAHDRALYAALECKKANEWPRAFHHVYGRYCKPMYKPLAPCPKCQYDYRSYSESHVCTAEHWATLTDVTTNHVETMISFIDHLPDCRETKYGYKVLRVGTNKLYSPLFNGEWLANTVKEATCMYSCTTPKLHCTCGIYMFYDIMSAIHYCNNENRIITVVEHGGRIVEHDYGLRAQYAIIRKIVPLGKIKLIENISQHMDIPILDKDELWD